jgi:hypothetical protein
MAIIESALANALNALLEEERASVEMEVALASGATEYLERQALATMGGEDLDACCDLRAHLERLEVMVSRRIHGSVYIVLSEERYDARLRAFAHHQRMVGVHAEVLLEADLDRELRRILTELRDAHVRHSVWCEERANEFAATRLIDFRTPAGRAILRRPVGGAPLPAPPNEPIPGELPSGELPSGELPSGELPSGEPMRDNPPPDEPSEREAADVGPAVSPDVQTEVSPLDVAPEAGAPSPNGTPRSARPRTRARRPAPVEEAPTLEDAGALPAVRDTGEIEDAGEVHDGGGVDDSRGIRDSGEVAESRHPPAGEAVEGSKDAPANGAPGTATEEAPDAPPTDTPPDTTLE